MNELITNLSHLPPRSSTTHWLWQGDFSDGRAITTTTTKRSVIRLIVALQTGKPVNPNARYLRACNEPACVNPAHFTVRGTNPRKPKRPYTRLSLTYLLTRHLPTTDLFRRDDPEHWLWDTKLPRLRGVNPVRHVIANWLGQPLHPQVRLHRICDEPRCVNPAHYKAIGRNDVDVPMLNYDVDEDVRACIAMLPGHYTREQMIEALVGICTVKELDRCLGT
jgi:hypothetical protein